jgi:hypothetical protein
MADPTSNFLPMNRHLGWGGNPDLHPVPLHGQDRNGDAVANGNCFPTLATKNQHVNLLVKVLQVWAAGSGFPAVSRGHFCQLLLT